MHYLAISRVAIGIRETASLGLSDCKENIKHAFVVLLRVQRLFFCSVRQNHVIYLCLD